MDSPLLAGVYDLHQPLLQKSWTLNGHSSSALNTLFEEILSADFELDSIFYARGPGRFSALKMTHIFLHTLCLVKSYKLFSVSSFYFNSAAPIHAFANKYFIQENQGIALKDFSIKITQEFVLPEVLNIDDFDTQNKPLYILPPV